MLGFILSSVLVFLIFLGIIVGIASSSKDEVVVVKDKSILHLTLDKQITDKAPSNPLANFDFINMTSKQGSGLYDILKALNNAKTDKQIAGVYLDISSIPAGIATVEEIRNALLDFKTSGKFLVSYSEMYDQKTYYLATACDKIYLNPQGALDFRGLSADIMFFKGALDKLGIEPQILRHGKFKSAVEPFILDKMSDANREQTKTYLTSIWNHIVKGISTTRKISEAELMAIADSMLIRNPSAALKYKMVDELLYKDQLVEKLMAKVAAKSADDINYITLAKYLKTPAMDKASKSKDHIAVIFATGDIVSGKTDESKIGSESLSESIRKAANDDKVKAIVLRVNSPGGSALASDVIWREIILAKAKKPVVASMGDVAASGGYYISCAANKIIASPNTITGSIGVFGLMFNAQKLITEKIGVTYDNVKTNEYADLGGIHRPFRPQERAIMQQGVEDVYDTFISRVAEGRKITKAQVDSIGQGRVWTGIDAKRIGLVDDFGGLEKAITVAAELAKLKEYKIEQYPKDEEAFERIFKMISGDVESSIITKYFGDEVKYYEGIMWMKEADGIQARMPFVVDIY